MRALDHLRLHLTLALAGALLIEWLHWHVAAIVVALIVVDLGLATVGRPLWRDRRPPLGQRRPAPVHDAAPTSSPPTRPRLPRPIALTRALGADCASCRGFGCSACAYTGLH